MLHRSVGLEAVSRPTIRSGVSPVLITVGVEDLGDGGSCLEDDDLDRGACTVAIFAHQGDFVTRVLDRPDLATVPDDTIGGVNASAEFVINVRLGCEALGWCAKALGDHNVAHGITS